MNFRIDRNFNWNIQGLFQGLEKAVKQPAAQPPVQTLETAKSAAGLTQMVGRQIVDIGASLLRQQLQAGAAKASSVQLFLPKAVSVAKTSNVMVPASTPKPAFEPFNPNAALGFFGQLAGGF